MRPVARGGLLMFSNYTLAKSLKKLLRGKEVIQTDPPFKNLIDLYVALNHRSQNDKREYQTA